MVRSARKFILIPEHRPLHAMCECFGPKHGPLLEPCPTPIPVIGKLLKQKGDEALTIMEVLKSPDGTTTAPIKLTTENYTLSYEEILGGATMPAPATLVKPDESEAIGPVIVTVGERQKAVEIPVGPGPEVSGEVTPTEIQVEDTVTVGDTVEVYHGDTGTTSKEAAMEQIGVATSGCVTAENEGESSEPEVAVTSTAQAIPTAGMTKAQRKAYNREQRALEAARQAQIHQNSTIEETADIGGVGEEPQG